ncbi:MAG: histidine ammonia-lyase [Spirochaetes bacterium]|nr:histidine ammonia-lyase [Spirochaetota bacterium]
MIEIDGNSLKIEDVILICRHNEKVRLAKSAIPNIIKSRKYVDKIIAENKTVYGITTGVGELANQLISADDAERLQQNLIRSHSVNVGVPFPEDVVRGIILLRANTLAKGYSGIRVELIELLLELLNRNIYPHIPSQGSVGASGDLSPLSHLALVMMGEGECWKNGEKVASSVVFKNNKLEPVKYLPKEGLALINGTQVMASQGCIILHQAELLLKNAMIASSMSLEALLGTAKAFDPKIHAVRPHPGQIQCADNIRKITANSQIISSHKNCERVQDAYTLRCVPQVYGAILDTINFVKNTLIIEINSATDNPLIFADQEEVISGGNFHGEPLAFALDYLGIALSEIANISERTIDRLVNPHVSGLPPFLAANSGINSGFMIAQYTAAALVSENKVLAHPASVDSIPTSAGQEDHVSMGSISAKHAWQIMKNVQNVIAIEMLCAAQGIDFQKNQCGNGTQAAFNTIRQHVAYLDDDRPLYNDIEKIKNVIIKGEIVDSVEKVVGSL